MDEMNDLTDLNEMAPVLIGPGEVSFAHAVARKYLKNSEEAADVAQEALLLAHRHRASFRGASRYRSWLYRIVATTALSYLRSRKRRPTSSLEDEAIPEVSDDRPTAEARLAAFEAAAVVHRALDEMGHRYAPVFRMRFEQDLGEAEIAHALGLTVGTVKIRTHRARRYLQERVPVLLAA